MHRNYINFEFKSMSVAVWRRCTACTRVVYYKCTRHIYMYIYILNIANKIISLMQRPWLFVVRSGMINLSAINKQNPRSTDNSITFHLKRDYNVLTNHENSGPPATCSPATLARINCKREITSIHVCYTILYVKYVHTR